MEKRQDARMHCSRSTVKDARVSGKHRCAADDVDLAKLPAPDWHRKDGGPFIGSGSIVIMRDPDGGWINASIYRVQVHGQNRVTDPVRPPGPPRRHHRQEILGRRASPARSPWSTARTRRCSSPASNICRPASRNTTSPAPSRARRSRCSPGPVTGLPLPAHAEIILEGELLPHERADAPGRSIWRVHRILRLRKTPVSGYGCQSSSTIRNDPILLGSPPLKPPRFHFGLPFRAAKHLEQSPDRGRRYGHRWRVAARRATDDRRLSQATL